MYTLDKVTKIFQDGDKSKVALQNISLKFENKGLYIIEGKSGCGKTTLLNLLSGFEEVSEGSFLIGGELCHKIDIDLFRRHDLGFVFQAYNLFESETVFDNVILPLKLLGKTNDISNTSLVDEVLTKLGLLELKDKRVNKLSGGEKQRVAIARTMIKKPKVILADEPTGNLDEENRKIIYELLQEQAKDILVIVVTHDNHYFKNVNCSKIKLVDGEVVSANWNHHDETIHLIEEREAKPLGYGFYLYNGIKKIKKYFGRSIISLFLLVISFLFLYVSFYFATYDFDNSYRETYMSTEDQTFVIETAAGYKPGNEFPFVNEYYVDALLLEDPTLIFGEVVSGDLYIDYIEETLYGPYTEEVMMEINAPYVVEFAPSDFLKLNTLNHVMIDDDNWIIIPDYYADLILLNTSYTSYDDLMGNTMNYLGFTQSDFTEYKVYGIQKTSFDEQIRQFNKQLNEELLSDNDITNFISNIGIDIFVTRKHDTTSYIRINSYQLDDSLVLLSDSKLEVAAKNDLGDNEVILHTAFIFDYFQQSKTDITIVSCTNIDSIYDINETCATDIYNQFFKDKEIQLSFAQYEYYGVTYPIPEMTVVGFSFEEYNTLTVSPSTQQRLSDDFTNQLPSKYTFVSGSEKSLLTLTEKVDITKHIGLTAIQDAQDMYESAREIMLIISIISFVLAVLQLLNYVLFVIRKNVKEIGIYQALGVTIKEISRMYLSILLIVILISYLCSMGIVFIGLNIINKRLTQVIIGVSKMFYYNHILNAVLFISVVFVVVILALVTINKINKLTTNQILHQSE